MHRTLIKLSLAGLLSVSSLQANPENFSETIKINETPKIVYLSLETSKKKEKAPNYMKALVMGGLALSTALSAGIIIDKALFTPGEALTGREPILYSFNSRTEPDEYFQKDCKAYSQSIQFYNRAAKTVRNLIVLYCTYQVLQEVQKMPLKKWFNTIVINPSKKIYSRIKRTK
jgi:hypothetical protein